MKHTISIFILIISLSLNAQTSIYTELTSSIGPSDYYLLKQEEAREITVNVITNPNDKDRYVDKWIYEFQSSGLIRTKLYRDGDLLSTSEFELDSKKRKISNKVNFKHKALGWERTNSKIVYGENLKELHLLNAQGKIKYKMIVEYDSLNSPVKITSLSNGGEFDGLEIADYDYKNGTYVYKVYRNDMSIVLDKIEYYNPNYLIQKNEYGDIIEMYWPTAKKGSNVVHKIEYKYDKKGNWTKIKIMLITPDRKKVLETATRKIQYIH